MPTTSSSRVPKFLVLCLSATTANALITPPSTLSTTLRVVSSNNIALHALPENDAHHHQRPPDQKDGGLFDSVGNLFHQVFPNAPAIPSIPDMSHLTSSLPHLADLNLSDLNLSDLTLSSLLPNIPDLLTTTTSSDNQNGKKYYSQVNEFDASLAKDIEEALQMANNLAAERGLGDMTISKEGSSNGSSNNKSVRDATTTRSSPFFRENNGAYQTLQERKLKRRESGQGMIADEAKKKPSMFQQNNAADWNRDVVTQRQTRSSSSVGGGTKKNGSRQGGESHVNAREDKPSLFHEINAADRAAAAAAQERTLKSSSRGNNAAETNSYANAADVKQQNNNDPRREQQQQSSIGHGRNDGLNARKIGSYANAADVKQNDNDLRREQQQQSSIGHGRNDGLNARKIGSYANAADVLSHAAKKEMASSYRRDDLESKARESARHHVDAATAAAKAAWGEASTFYSSNERSPQPPPMDNASVDQSRNVFSGRDGSRDTKRNKIGTNFPPRTYDMEVEDGSQESYHQDSENDIDRNYDDMESESHDQGYYRKERRSDNVFATSEQTSDRLQNGQPTYIRHKRSFDGGIDDDIDNYSTMRDDATSPRKIIITNSALELSHSLKLDIYEIFQHKRREVDLGVDGTDDMGGVVNEDDVRDYLDRRYDKLFSKLSKDKEETTRASQMPRRNPSLDVRTQKRSDYRVKYGKSQMRDNARPMRSEEDDWEAYYDDRDEDEYGWRRSQFHQYAPKRPPPKQQPRRQREETVHQYRNNSPSTQSSNNDHPRSRSTDDDMRGYRRPSYGISPVAISPIARVPLSQLISTPRAQSSPGSSFDRSNSRQMSDDKYRPASVPLSQLVSNPRAQSLPESSFDLSNSSQLPDDKFREPYQEQRQERRATLNDTPLAETDVNTSKRLSFQQMSQSKFREPYTKIQVDQTMATQPRPVQQVSDDDFTESYRALTEDVHIFQPPYQRGTNNDEFSAGNLSA